MGRMNLKHRKRRKIWLFILLIGLLYVGAGYLSSTIHLENGNEEFVKQLLQDSNSHLIYEKQDKNLFSKFLKMIGNIELKEPVTILENTFVYNKVIEQDTPVFSYMNNQNTVIDSPRVYIYSTHPTEGYKGEALKEYNTGPGVLMASYLLQDKLNEMGIPTIVEERSAATYIKEHNLSYEESYTATRVFASDMVKRYPNLELIIDLHRDGIDKNISTIDIDGTKYARVMFVMKNTLSNIKNAQKMSDMINQQYPNLSRGIYDKHNGKFNQDINGNMMLLELGGQDNTVEEVVNTVNVLKNIIKEYLDER